MLIAFSLARDATMKTYKQQTYEQGRLKKRSLRWPFLLAIKNALIHSRFHYG
jgi:hypothetical protein